MTPDQAAKLIEAIAKLINAIAWPAAALYFGTQIVPLLLKRFNDSDDISVDALGIKATFSRKKAEATKALTAAAAAKTIEDDQTPQEGARAAELAVSRSITPASVKRLSSKRILWVDDRPSNNIRERQAFEAVGIKFDIALDTEEAIALINENKFDLIISDMGRPPDPKAGYTLLDQLRNTGNNTPYVIYAASRSPEHRAETKRHGGIDCTNRADELFQIVTAALSIEE